MKFFLRKNACDIYTCIGCGFSFVHPIPNVETVYDETYFTGAEGGHGYTDYDRDKEPMIPTFQEYLQRVRSLRPQSKTLLDVGAATGFFVALAKTAGFEASGVEIAEYAAEAGRSKGLDIMTGTLADVSAQKKGPYDVVAMLDVIEHVRDPRAELAHAHELLQPGGVLVINTPDAGSLYAKILGRNWHLIVPPEHLQYFSRPHMTRLLSESGFKVVEMTTIGKKFTLPYIFKTLYAWQGLSLWASLERSTSRRFLSRIAIPINLHDNMFLVAERI